MLFLFPLFAGVARADSRPPNFVVIFCDDLGYGDLGAFGNPTIRTPHLDRLALEGQKWTQFYSADPICTPSRAGLLTGRYPIRNGMTSSKRGVLFPDSAKGLPAEEVTIAEVLKEQGYATAAVGKWHLGHLPEYLPMAQGFDSYYGIPYSNDMAKSAGAPNYREEAAKDPDYLAEPSHFNVPLMENEAVVEQPADQRTITRRYTERAVSIIREQKDRPFFLYLAHSLPHIPLFAGEEWLGKSPRGLYGDVIEEIDWSVGQVVSALREEGLERETIVLFTSDNGPWLSFRTHGGSAGPLRAGKGTCFEGGQRVPTVFWGPGRVVSGVVTELGSTIDLMSTFSALAGAEAPTDRKMDSYDLSEVLEGKGKSPRMEFFYWMTGRLHAVRKGPWKLHIRQRQPVNYGRELEMERPELYHLESDIGEAYELAQQHPERVAELQAMIAEHLEDTADSMPEQLSARIQ